MAANAKTLVGRLPIKHKSDAFDEVLAYKCVFDGSDNTDLEVFDPDSDKRFVVVGLFLGAANAITITFKSESTTLLPLPIPANGGYGTDDIKPMTLHGTALGDALKINCGSVAVTLLILVAQYRNMEIQ